MFLSAVMISRFGSAKKASIIKKYGDEHNIIVKFEELKILVQDKRVTDDMRRRIFAQTLDDDSFEHTLEKNAGALEEK